MKHIETVTREKRPSYAISLLEKQALAQDAQEILMQLAAVIGIFADVKTPIPR